MIISMSSYTKKKNIKFKNLNLSVISNFISRKGFTLIEILIVFVISSIIVGISVNSFTSYRNSQTYNQNLSDFVNLLNNARSRAISQVKPSSCGANTLKGIEVEIAASGRVYKQNAVCGTSIILLSEGSLSQGMSFAPSSTTRVLFNVAYGNVDTAGAIGISGLGKASTISINKIGLVSIISDSSITPTYSLSSTPIPTTLTPTPLTPTPTTGVTGSVSVRVASISPNPATRSSAQGMTFTATVTGTNCTPVGSVEFYRNSESARFTAGVLSSSNPANASASYNSGGFTVGTHQIYARFVPGGGNCSSAESSRVNLVVN